MSKINYQTNKQRKKWFENWGEATSIPSRTSQNKVKLQLFQKEVATLGKNLDKADPILQDMRIDILPLDYKDGNTLEYREKIINNTLAYCEKLDEKFYQSFERIGMVDWQKNALTELKEKLGELKKKHKNEKRDKKIDTREDYDTLADLSLKVVYEFRTLQKDFNEKKNEYDESQKAIDKKKGFKYYWKKFTGFADTPPPHSYHAWIEGAENVINSNREKFNKYSKSSKKLFWTEAAVAVSDSIKPGLYNADASKHDIRRALQEPRIRGRSSSVKLTTRSTKLLPDAPPPNAQKAKTGSPKTGPARH